MLPQLVHYLILIVLFFQFSPQTYAKATLFDCDVNANYLQNTSCRLKAISWEHNTANVETDIINVVRNVSVGNTYSIYIPDF